MRRASKKKTRKWPRRGEEGRMCRFCARRDGLVRKYGLIMCRQCFREKAPELGFRKYN